MIVTEVEQVLAKGPFGDSGSLKTNSDRFYAGVTALFADVFDGFTLTWPWPASPQARILIRGCLDEALIHLPVDRVKAREAALEAVRLLDRAAGVDQDPLGEQDLPVVLTAWQDNPLADRILDRFHQSMSNGGYDYRVTTPPPDPDTVAAVDGVFDFLADLLPTLAPPVASMSLGVVVFDGGLGSAFVNGTPSVVYLNRVTLRDRLKAADALLHECLHQKLVEVRLTRRMLRAGYDDATSYEIVVPWGGGRLFSVDRALAAFHVYVHCTLLHLAAQGRTDLPDAELDERLAVRFARASFFAEQLDTPEAATELDVDGRRLVSWMRAAVDRMSTATTSTGRPLSEAGHFGDYPTSTR